MFGPRTSWILQPESLPCISFRNISRYSLTSFKKEYSSKVKIQSEAWKQTLYYGDRLSEHFIPSSLLYENLLEEILSKNNSQDVNTFTSHLACCHQNLESLVIHTIGKENNQLILQTKNDILSAKSSGFVLDSFEAPIRQISLASKSSLGFENHLLTRYILYSMKIYYYCPRSY